MESLVKAETEKGYSEENSQRVLHEVDVEVIDLFVRIVKFLGLPKSVGELYGLLFVSPEPLSMEDMMKALKMSKGATSQGLKQLRTIGAIEVCYVPGDRRDYYKAVTNLGFLVSGFIKERVEPGVSDLGERLRVLEDEDRLPKGKAEFIKHRMGKLKQWQSKAAEVVPAIGQFLVGH